MNVVIVVIVQFSHVGIGYKDVSFFKGGSNFEYKEDNG